MVCGSCKSTRCCQVHSRCCVRHLSVPHLLSPGEPRGGVAGRFYQFIPRSRGNGSLVSESHPGPAVCAVTSYAIIAGASQTYTEFASYHDKLFFLIENGEDRFLMSDEMRITEADGKLDLDLHSAAVLPFTLQHGSPRGCPSVRRRCG